MGTMNVYLAWLVHALFWLGIVVASVGLYVIILPSSAMSVNGFVNKWVSTDRFFRSMDQPVYKEALFYKWHRLFGVLILLGSAYVLYRLWFQTDVDVIAKLVPVVKTFQANAWIYQSLVIFLLAMNAIIFILSVIIIFRPSLLKQAEGLINRWVQTDRPLERLNDQYQIPNNVLPGNVRLFGLLVLAGGMYIALSTGVVLVSG